MCIRPSSTGNVEIVRLPDIFGGYLYPGSPFCVCEFSGGVCHPLSNPQKYHFMFHFIILKFKTSTLIHSFKGYFPFNISCSCSRLRLMDFLSLNKRIVFFACFLCEYFVFLY